MSWVRMCSRASFKGTKGTRSGKAGECRTAGPQDLDPNLKPRVSARNILPPQVGSGQSDDFTYERSIVSFVHFLFLATSCPTQVLLRIRSYLGENSFVNKSTLQTLFRYLLLLVPTASDSTPFLYQLFHTFIVFSTRAPSFLLFAKMPHMDSTNSHLRASHGRTGMPKAQLPRGF